MDIQTRKVHFVQEFLRIADEELVIKLEKLLNVERKKRLAMELGSLTLEELNCRQDPQKILKMDD